MTTMAETAETRAHCPICKRPVVEQFRPFCSKRCADVDLHRWLSGRYAVAGREEEDEDGTRAEHSPDEGR